GPLPASTRARFVQATRLTRRTRTATMDTEVQSPPLSPQLPDALLEQLCEHLNSLAGPDGPVVCDFAREFVGRATRQLGPERSLDERTALVLGAFRFLQRSRPEQVSVEVLN